MNVTLAEKCFNKLQEVVQHVVLVKNIFSRNRPRRFDFASMSFGFDASGNSIEKMKKHLD